MNAQKIQEQLDAARLRQRNLRKQIDTYREILLKGGYDPDKPKIDLLPRNKNIYKAWKRGKLFVKIAAEANLSTTRVSSICKRIEVLIHKTPIPKDYQDLARYRTDD